MEGSVLQTDLIFDIPSDRESDGPADTRNKCGERRDLRPRVRPDSQNDLAFYAMSALRKSGKFQTESRMTMECAVSGAISFSVFSIGHSRASSENTE